MALRIWLIVVDLLIFLASFCISLLFKPSAEIISYVESNLIPFAIFNLIWLTSSFLFGKFQSKGKDFSPLAKRIFLSNASSLALLAVLMFTFYSYAFSRIVVFGTIGFATFFEYIFFGVWYLFKQSHEIFDEPVSLKGKKRKDYKLIAETERPIDAARKKTIKKSIVEELGQDVYEYFNRILNLGVESTLIVSTTTRFNIDNQPSHFFNTIINLKRVNDIRWINKFFESINNKLPKGGLFVCRAETKNLRKQRILKKFPPVINLIYYTVDFIIKRVLPKFTLTKGLYFFLTRGENRVITRAELLGRLYSCGFEVVDEEFVDNHFYVVCRKVKLPAYDLEATYGPLIKLRRIGKGGKEIKVYKMRTMHPYAEYLQEYVFEKHNLEEGGKFKDDFRISTLGRIMRRLWIDELPMIINLLKGDLKIVGVRPLSKHYFSLYTKELQEMRTRFRPGLIPPFYADNPKTLDEIMASELKYLDAYAKRPLWTDIKYFFVAVYNIIFKKYRSS
ncbi:MAG TPA: sugar transferase [Tenuifilaceae bacterium]|nr:sugar transferase [Tenuifilaceae bacterium]